MRASEIVAATAFVYFAVVCWHGDMRLARRLQVTTASLLILGLIWFMSLQAVMAALVAIHGADRAREAATDFATGATPRGVVTP